MKNNFIDNRMKKSCVTETTYEIIRLITKGFLQV